MGIKDLKDLMIDQLRELYHAEVILQSILPKMAVKAGSDRLKKEFELHSKKAEGQLSMLSKALDRLGEKPEGRFSRIMNAISEEVQDLLDNAESPQAVDAGLIALAQKAKHYKMACYGTLREYARQLGYQDVAGMLHESLQEEKEEDQSLTDTAEGDINKRAERS